MIKLRFEGSSQSDRMGESYFAMFPNYLQKVARNSRWLLLEMARCEIHATSGFGSELGPDSCCRPGIMLDSVVTCGEATQVNGW